ncbi:MAG: D-alanyl-D-alanine endopeptidase [Gammaproteobacteria bacterium]|nr:D-alanyl-D-alanine endopeptidase [Gammaproteobacteria bacterium]MBU1623916.1 D-alanyl-D-alanine endopeptidase [Gammaproteobacteria bacterium]MBU1982133.1 D-alanyl-D-alanine endopeptidase [Gammaproteobacteria bacterium]
MRYFLISALFVTSAFTAQAVGFEHVNHGKLPRLGSAIAMIYDEQTGQPVYSKNINNVVPIASITKLMTAMVVLDAHLPLDEPITITREDRDRLKGTKSRLKDGMTLTRGDLLTLAIMASENRAASALARTYPGGTPVLVAMMNAKARELGMDDTHFEGPVGLQSENVSTAKDLVQMVLAAQSYEHIQRASTQSRHVVKINARQSLRYGNTNPLVRSRNWDIGLSKTGYISEAGRCLVMQAKLSERPTVIVLLDSWGKNTRVGDANRIKTWMERPPRRARQSRLR